MVKNDYYGFQYKIFQQPEMSPQTENPNSDSWSAVSNTPVNEVSSKKSHTLRNYIYNVPTVLTLVISSECSSEFTYSWIKK